MTKKIFFTFFMLIAFNLIFAQTKIAVKAGYNYTTARAYQDDQKLTTGSKNGYGIGFLFKVPFEGVLHFSPSISYNRKGYQYTPKTGLITRYDNSIHYIDIMPALSVDFPIGANFFVISAGPNFSGAFSGTEKTTTAGVTTSSKMKFSLSNSYSYIDLGMNSSIGIHMKTFFIETGFQLGLANINNDAEKDHRDIRNRMFSVQLGYYIK